MSYTIKYAVIKDIRKLCLRKLNYNRTFLTVKSCPSIIASSVTQTSHVITGSTVSTVSFTLSTTVDTVQPFTTFLSRKTYIWIESTLKKIFFFYFEILTGLNVLAPPSTTLLKSLLSLKFLPQIHSLFL